MAASRGRGLSKNWTPASTDSTQKLAYVCFEDQPGGGELG
jgi:hypothetical protein